MIQKDDLVIVAHLRQNARISLTKLAHKTGMPVSTLYDRVHALDRLGVTRLCALLDFGTLGFRTQAMLLLKTTKRDELQEYLRTAWPVNTLVRINNGYDFLAECIFKDLRELEEFCEKLQKNYGVRNIETHLLVEELARENFLADPKEVPHE